MTRLTRCLLLGAGALVAGRSLPGASVVSLLAPQDPETGAMEETVACGADCDKRECESGCSAQNFCLSEPCYEGDKKCTETPVPCPVSKDEFTSMMCFQDKTEDKPCPAERRAELCADLKGTVCAERLGHEHRNVETPLEYKASHVKKGECVSILEGTEDEWCRKTCTSANLECPKDHCVCGDLSDVDMTPTDPLAEANKNANDLKTLMDNACDFDAQGCNQDPVPQCSACYIHFESCRNKPHFEDDGVTPKAMDIDSCMDEVSHTVGGCETCDTDDSKEAYKVRTGEHDPPGVSQPTHKAR